MSEFRKNTPATFVASLARPALTRHLWLVFALLMGYSLAHAGPLDVVPQSWWVANTGNAGPGPHGGTVQPGGNCESCLQASGGYHWTGVLNFTGNTPSGCQFRRGNGSVQDDGCTVRESIYCPANSTGTSTCTCNSGYRPDPTATSCVRCPEHTSGTPCTCDAGYQFNAAGTSCQELYTITLHDLGGKVMPKRTRDAFAAVAKSDGTAAIGVQVGLQLTVVPEEDGYDHAAGQHTAPHDGKLLPKAASTDGEGRLNFVFEAGEAGGIHTITATCANCAKEATGKITVPGCPVPALTAPPFDDACATVLENLGSTLAQKDAACGSLTPELVAGRACLKEKLDNLSPSIPMKISSDIRSVAYQAHLRQVWDRMKDVVDWMDKHPTIKSACATRRAEFAAEKGCDKAGPCKSEPNEVCYPESSTQRSHCLVARPANPSPSDAKHTEGKAFDVSQTRTINPLQAVLAGRTPPEKIPQFLNAPTTTYPNGCGLSWGGTFIDNIDLVHFYVP